MTAVAKGKRLAVFSVRKLGRTGGVVWTRAGSAFVNSDGSMNLWLDVLPLDGRLHVREAFEKKDPVKDDLESVAPAAGAEAEPMAVTQ